MTFRWINIYHSFDPLSADSSVVSIRDEDVNTGTRYIEITGHAPMFSCSPCMPEKILCTRHDHNYGGRGNPSLLWMPVHKDWSTSGRCSMSIEVGTDSATHSVCFVYTSRPCAGDQNWFIDKQQEQSEAYLECFTVVFGLRVGVRSRWPAGHDTNTRFGSAKCMRNLPKLSSTRYWR